MTGKIATKVVRQIVKSLIISGVILAICIMIMQVNQSLGIILMMLYSSFMVIKSSSKEMVLNKFTALLPGVMSIITFLIMLGLIGLNDPIMPMIGMGIGVVVGFLMARGHKVYEKNGVVYAKRTFFYILIWALSMLFIQGSRLAGAPEITDFCFLLNGFSTAMMLVLSVMLFLKKTNNSSTASKKNIGTVMSSLAVIFCVITPIKHVYAISFNSSNDAELTQSVGRYAIDDSTFSPFPGEIYRDSYTIGSNTVGLHSDQGNEGKYTKKPDNYYFTLIDKSIYRPSSSMTITIKQLEQQVIGFKRHCTSDGKVSYQKFSEGKGIGQICTVIYPGIQHSIEYLWRTDRWILRHKAVFVIGEGQSVKWQRDTSKSAFSSIIAKLQSVSEANNSTPISHPPRQLNPPPAKHSDFEFSDDEAAAGGLVALIMLLTGLGINAASSAATTAAQEAANVAAMAGAGSSELGDHNNWGYDANTHSNGTLMLDGDEAKDWMEKNGYLDGAGNKTDEFKEFMASMPSQSGPGLQGFAGDVDKEGNPTGDYVIIVPDERPVEEDEPTGGGESEEKEEPTGGGEPEEKEKPTGGSGPVKHDESDKKEEDIQEYEKQPCNDQKYRLKELAGRVAEERKVIQYTLSKRAALLRSIENRRKATLAKIHVDLGSIIWSVMTIGKVPLVVSLFQSASAKYLKHLIDIEFEQRVPDGKDYKILGNAEKDGYAMEGLGSIISEEMKEATAKANGFYQICLNSHSYGSTFSKFMFALEKTKGEIHQLRLQNIRAYHQGKELDEMRKEAEKDLNDCIEAHNMGGQ